jgi:hypothetical protein
MQHTRRDFIQTIGLLTMGLPLSTFTSCNSFKKVMDPFEALLLLQEAVRKSSDYLPTRKKEVVESKDPKLIFAFVRDVIQTYPFAVPLNIRYEASAGIRTYNYRWGDKGCLRYGAGTSYEKAHLLKSLLEEAGFKASLLYGQFDIDKIGWEKVFFAKHDLLFDADFPSNIDREIFRSRPVNAVKLEDERLEKVVQNVQKSLPVDFKYIDPNWDDLAAFMDVVELELEGKKVLLNPNIKDAKFGESYLENVLGQSGQHRRREAIRVRLKLINSSEPYRQQTFLDATFAPDQLFGNQLMIQFQSHLSTEEQLTLPRNRNQVFTPVMGLIGPNLTEEEQQKSFTKGKTIRVNGDTLEVKDDQLFVNDYPVQTGKEHPELRKKVRKLDGKLWTEGFPKVDIRFRANDASGEMINGLDGPDFELLENGMPIPFQWHPQQQAHHKILLLFDLSGSIPENFRDDEVVKFAKKLMSNIQAQTADVQFKAATFTGLFNYQLQMSSEWTKEVSVLEKQVNELKQLWDHCSALWNALADASKDAGADLIVFITDGDSYYDHDPLNKKKIVAQGCPVVPLGVGDTQVEACLEEMAYLTGGISRSVNEHQEAIDFISTFANDLKFSNYRLNYFSSDADSKNRKLTLRVKESKIEKTFNYTVPDRLSKFSPSWIGMHLEINYNGKNINRKLAGIPIHSRNPKWNPVLPEYRKETEAAFFGNYTICFEGTEPTTAVLLNELIEAKLSEKEVMKAIQNGTNEETIAALDKGFLTYPDDYFTMQNAFSFNSSKDHFCFQNGVKATFFSSYPNREGTIIKAVDILPFSQWRTIHKDPKKSFEISLRHSLQLMNLEALNYSKATLNLISESTLDWMIHSDARSWMDQMKDVTLYATWKTALQDSRDKVHLLPTGREALAFYDLDVNSGTIFAQLMNGSGGGEQETRDRFAALDRALTAFDQVFKRLGGGGAVGAWIGLEKKKLEYLMIATIAIYTMDADQAAADLNKTLQKHFCNQFEDAAAQMAGGLGDMYKDVLDFVSVATGKSLSPCG